MQNGWFFRRSISESMHWMVLRRPVELAALTGQVILSDSISRFLGGVLPPWQFRTVRCLSFWDSQKAHADPCTNYRNCVPNATYVA
jgi:hypothetical protein